MHFILESYMPQLVHSAIAELPDIFGSLIPYTATRPEVYHDVLLGKMDFCAFSSSALVALPQLWNYREGISSDT